MLSDILLLIVAIVTVTSSVRTPEDDWTRFKEKYNKQYLTTDEDIHRMGLWLQRRDFIKLHNEAADRGLHSYRVGMNQFGDMTKQEISQLTAGGIRTDSSNVANGNMFSPSREAVELPVEVDWRTKHVVTPVQNQDRSCRSFLVMKSCPRDANYQAYCAWWCEYNCPNGITFKPVDNCYNFIYLTDLQCNHGCYGGLMDNCFRYIKYNNGIDSNAVYPYQGISIPRCRFVRSGVAGTVSGFVDIPSGNETALQVAVATIGPIASAIHAEGEGYLFYKSGIYDDKFCTEHPNQGMLVAGYGVDQGRDYWLMKNTLGVQWGIEGYMLLVRNEENKCGVATIASYPLV